MNRETKIGMLTGLGVIILLGVLLSAYFEKDNSALNQAAAMRDVGENYREVARAPLGVPTATPVANVQLPVMTLSAPGQATPPAAFATTPADGPQGPVVAAPVSAVPSGTVADGTKASQTPAGTLGEKTLATNQSAALPTIYVPGEAGKTAATAVVPTGAPVPHATDYEYTIVKGDSLVAIAKKFYHYATKTNLDKIVAANPKVLKDAKTPLVVGKKLVLPGIGADGKPKSDTTSVAGSAKAPAVKALAASAAKAPAVKTKTYTVVQGDNLAKIATKMMGSASKANQNKIIALNGIKNPDAIRTGLVLKIPG